MRRAGVQLSLLLTALLTVEGVGADAGEGLEFATRVLPLLTKAGCNAGSCHGAAVGQGGFKLSLLGYDPRQDYANLTRELGARRVDYEVPASSLFLRKATDEIDHEGGRRFRPDSATFRTLQAWVAAGAPFGPPELRVAGIVVEPPDVLLPDADQSVQLRVTATLTDGRREDVTALALYSSNDDAVADVNKSGLVTTRARGLTSVMVRYSGQAVAARIAVPFGDKESSSDDFAPRNFIDEAVIAELRRLQLPASPLSDDAEFFRRVHLDLIGRLPEPESVRRFLAEPPSDEKRRHVIDELTADDAFVDFWTMKFGDWLLLRGGSGQEKAAEVYHEWVRGQIARNRPLDAMVRDLLLARGSVTENGPAGFFTLAKDPRDLGEHAGSMFLGVQIACARCHAHPADRWTQDDYHAFAAYFARVIRKGDTIEISDRGEVEHPKSGKPLAPRPLGAVAGAFDDTADRRVELAAWLVAPDNPFFARNLVNRVWKHLLGRGLVEPVDDLRPTNPASNPALHDALAARFAAEGFDLRWLVGEIARSRTYQLTSRTTGANRLDDRLFSHAMLKPLPAQVFVDAVAQVSGVPDLFADADAGTRAVQLVGSQTASYALDVLGRCGRERSCESSAPAGGGLAQALHLINGETINGKLRDGTLAHLLKSKASDLELVGELYLRALGRSANADEQAACIDWLARADDRSAAAEDLLWALLNSRDFAFNH